MSERMKKYFTAFLLILLAVIGTSLWFTSHPRVEIRTETVEKAAYRPDNANIEKMVNDYRASKGLKPLMHDERLCMSAAMKVSDMQEKLYFAHESPDKRDYSDYIRQLDLKWTRAGENLALNNVDDTEIVSGWKRSALHEKVMSDDYSNTCVKSGASDKIPSTDGVAHGGAYVIVQHFIKL